MLNGIGLVTGDPTIKISYPFVFHPGAQVTVTEPGDAKWIYMMLPLCKGDLITEIKIVYQRTDINSDLLLMRLIEQDKPTSATVLHNLKVKSEATGVITITSACHIEVKKSMILKLCLNFSTIHTLLEFGAIEVKYIPEYTSMETKIEDKPNLSFLRPREMEKSGKAKQIQSKLTELLFFKF